MKFLFEDDTFSFETPRTTGFANSLGADFGEVLATARQITDADQASWHRAWKATAARVAELGERSLAAGHRLTARDNLLRGRARQVMFDWLDTVRIDLPQPQHENPTVTMREGKS